MDGGRGVVHRERRRPGIGPAGLLLVAFLPVAAARADVVILQNGRAYAGHVEEATSRSIRLYDGNLRRIFAATDVKEVVNERADTSWVIVGDHMFRQGDWETAADAYREALKRTDQPDVVLKRLDLLRESRYHVPGGKAAESLLASGEYEQAATDVFGVLMQAKTAAQRHYWTDRLARAYVGLAAQRTLGGPYEVDPYLVYALSIAPTCGPAHALLGQRLADAGHPAPARLEWLLALDLDPLQASARARLAESGETWSFDPEQTDRSGLRDSCERLPPMAVTGDTAPMTTESLAQKIQERVARLGRQPARLLLASYLLDPTAALAYEGALPYPGYKENVPAILKESATPREARTPHDTAYIRSALAVRIDPRFFRAIGNVRTGHAPQYEGPDGSRGLIPLSRREWEIVARRTGVDWPYDAEAFDPEKNVEMACRYMDWLRAVVLKPYAGNRLDSLERIHDNL